MANRSRVKAPNWRTGFWSRSAGTATQISLAPRSIPAESGSCSPMDLMASDLVFASACLCFFIVLLANESGLAQTAKSLDILTNGLTGALLLQATTELVATSDSMLKVGLRYY